MTEYLHSYRDMRIVLILGLIGQIWSSQINTDRAMHRPPSRVAQRTIGNYAEKTADYWNSQAQETIREKVNKQLNTNKAKNLILFLGDGMSLATVTASRIYQGGEESQLSFDKFPYTALSKTYAVDRQVPDSANTATAYLGGVKANYATVGVTAQVLYGDCQMMNNQSTHVKSIAYHAQQAGLKTGSVTTARVTHASPAGVFAHSANRNWECDTDLIADNQDSTVCDDIAEQLIYGETGINLDVVMGGGRLKLLPKNVTDPEGNAGQRSDGINLIESWLKLHENQNAKFVYNRDELLNLDTETQQLLGLFAADHMDYNIDRDTKIQPSLAEMTEVAIKILSRNSDGFFLFVEGARIDMAHHNNHARKALNETIEFSKAVQRAVELTNETDTLIVVTADHAHTMSISGYPHRGNDILGYAGTGSDGLVYTTLNYANGAGYRHEINGSRYDLTQDDLNDVNFVYPAVAPLDSETHGGDDVGVFANGPWAHLFTGVIEENVIPHLMMYAACIGDGLTACNNNN